MATDRNVIRRVREDGRNRLVGDQSQGGLAIERVAAGNAMIVERPKVAGTRNGWPFGGRELVCSVDGVSSVQG